MCIVLVSGSRFLTSIEAVKKIESALAKLAPELLVVGDCPTGADAIARDWATWYSPSPIRVDFHRAEWSRFGRAAGPRRNAAMIDRLCSLRSLGRSVLCLFCWPPAGVASRGTVSTFKLAVAEGLPFVEIGERPAGLAALQPADASDIQTTLSA